MPSLDFVGSLFLPAIIAGPVFAVLALLGAHRHGRVHATDYAALLVPVLLFFFVGNAREELHTGVALLVWPVLVALACTYFLAAKVFVIDRFIKNTSRSSLALLVSLAVGAILLALSVPQLPE